jgi:PAS domain S-box-containing protein
MKKKTHKQEDIVPQNQQFINMNATLAESEMSYRSIFNNATDAIYIQDREGVFIDVNPAATTMYGYTHKEMVGYTPEKLSAPGLNDLEETRNHLIKAFNGEPQRFEWWGKRKNSEIFPKEVVLNKGLYFGQEVVFAMARDMTERSMALEALKESEDKYRSLTDQLPVGVYRTTVDGQLIYSNPALVKILNYDSIDELLKLNVSQLYVNPSDRENQLEASKKTSSVKQSVFQLKKKTGEMIWVKDNSRLVFNKHGIPIYFDGILQEITESIRAENAIKENEANLKAIIENTLESIWSVNRNYEVQYVNEVFAAAFKQTFGVKLAKGINIVESLPPEIQPLWKEKYERTFKNEHFVFEERIDIGGKSIYIEVAMNPIVVDSKVVGASLYGKDVTEKMIARNQLQYLSDLQKILIDLSSGFINLPLKEIEPAIHQSLNEIGEFVGADRAYVFDYNFINQTATNTFEWCRLGIETELDNLQAVPLGEYTEWINIHKRGEIVMVKDVSELPENNLQKFLRSQDIISVLTIPLIYEGECLGFVGFDSVKQKHVYTEYEQQLLQVYAQTLVNVKERLIKEQKMIAAKEKAEETDRLKSAFLANMSHEIRTPMNGIIGFLDLLREPDLSEENKSAYIDIVTQSGHRLLDTINDIIEISKIESGELKINKSSVNICELMAYYHGFFRQQTDQKGLKYIISNQLPAETKYFQTDRVKLESIITNLLKNAIKFTSKGYIEFGCFLESENLIFYIKDTGAGISEDRLEIIFERFVQADLSSSRPQEGSGLGLSIVKAYVQMLNGKIMVHSDPGKGSRFSFSIPYFPAHEESSENEMNITLKASNIFQSKILIAEDDYASYLYLKSLLSTESTTFIHTTTGTETVKAVRENPDISLIIMDLRMPGLTGFEATRQIRQFNKFIPIIAQTAYALSGDREMALSSGCNDYISKPLKASELKKMVFHFIGRKSTD